MPDQLEELFADLRAETTLLVRAPGVAAARRTVRRRRVVASTAGATAMVAIAGGAALVAIQPREAADTAVTAARDPQQAAERGLQAFSGLPALEERAGYLDDPTTVTLQNIPRGEYAVVISCAGGGTVTYEIRRAGGRGGGQIDCAQGEPVLVDAQLLVQETVEVRLTGNSAGAFALRVIDRAEMVKPPQVSAESESNANIATALLGPSEEIQRITTTVDQILPNGPFAKGTWLVRYACAGRGTVALSVGIRGKAQDSGRRTMRCDADGEVGAAIPVQVDAEAVIEVRANADTAADNYAGWAYLIQKK